MLGEAGIPPISEESGVDTECGYGSPSSEGPGCITDGGKRSVGSPHGAVPRRFSHCPTTHVAYVGIMRVRPNELTSSTRGFVLLVRTWHLGYTGPGMVNQEPDVERRAKWRRRSCGVSLVAVQRRDRKEWSGSGRTSCQYLMGRFLDRQAIVTALHTVPLYFSTCPLPAGL